MKGSIYNQVTDPGGSGSGAPPAAVLPAGGGGGSTPPATLLAAPPGGGAAGSSQGGSGVPASGSQAAPGAPTGAPASSGAADWKASLPESWRNDPSLKSFDSFSSIEEMLESFGKAYTDTKKLVGAKAPSRPASDAPPEQQAAWRKLVGAPDEPTGYGETLRPDDFPAEMWSSELDTRARELFHKHAITPEAAKEIAALHAEMIDQGLEASIAEDEQYLSAQIQELSREWGPKMDERKAIVASVAKLAGLPLTHAMFREAAVVKGLYNIAQMIGEKTLPNPDLPTSPMDGQRARMRDMMDHKSQTQIARGYRGEMGPEEQAKLQAELHRFLAAGGTI